MTSITKFLVAVMGAFALLTFNASSALAAEGPCTDPTGPFEPAQLSNYTGEAVLPYVFHSETSSSLMEWGWQQGSTTNSTSLRGTPNAGGWDMLLTKVPNDGEVLIRLIAHPDKYGECRVQVKNAITTPVVSVIGKKVGKQQVIADFEQRRDVSVQLTVTQKVRKKGKLRKAKTVIRSTSAMSARVRPGAFTGNLTVNAAGYDVWNQNYRLKAQRSKKRKK